MAAGGQWQPDQHHFVTFVPLLEALALLYLIPLVFPALDFTLQQ